MCTFLSRLNSAVCSFLGRLTDNNRLVGLAVKASASRAEDPGFEYHLRRDFSRSSHNSDYTIGNPVAIPIQAAGVIGSALRLVGPVSVYCDCVR